ncbi:hypothetical protein, partial [Dapis sp. BLCC M229]|uniref:hypothetical protein n=1 Tax=Dapis sp. BLCC M229 TaxID=3400188 RepID=UPI003CECC2B0
MAGFCLACVDLTKTFLNEGNFSDAFLDSANMKFVKLGKASAINSEQLIINNYPFLKRIGLSQ